MDENSHACTLQYKCERHQNDRYEGLLEENQNSSPRIKVFRGTSLYPPTELATSDEPQHTVPRNVVQVLNSFPDFAEKSLGFSESSNFWLLFHDLGR